MVLWGFSGLRVWAPDGCLRLGSVEVFFLGGGGGGGKACIVVFRVQGLGC